MVNEQITHAYRSGDLQAVIDIYENDPLALTGSSEVGLLMTAQSYFKLKQPDKAAPLFLRAGLASDPPKRQLFELAFVLSRAAGAVADGLVAAENLLALQPDHHEAAVFLRHYLPYLLRFDAVEAGNRQALAALQAGDAFARSCELPLDTIAWCTDEAIHATILDPKFPPFSEQGRMARRALPRPAGRIRVGYLSNDFSTYHATMILFRAAIEAHDPSRFDIRLFCYTPPGLVKRDAGFRASRSDIVEIGHLDDDTAAELIRSHQLDILVDLKGHTQDARVNLVNLGLAPVQVAFLGFPGSGPGIDCDYVISDAIVTPDSSKPHYHEKLCRLPESYQPNDNVHRPLPPAARREDLGLPAEGVVFASFNATRKISPEAFRAWMRILAEVPDSVLWVMCKDPAARQNLLSAAASAGLGADRFIFALPTRQESHLARLQAASIALDTFPYNGHTTTSDTLWAGLPVVALRGSSFASRVSESLLTAVGLPDLVADTLDAYVDLAVRLARAPETLEAIRKRLADNRFVMPLFDTRRFTQHLESAYVAMAERSRRGEAPDHLDMPALPPRTVPFRPA